MQYNSFSIGHRNWVLFCVFFFGLERILSTPSSWIILRTQPIKMPLLLIICVTAMVLLSGDPMCILCLVCAASILENGKSSLLISSARPNLMVNQLTIVLFILRWLKNYGTFLLPYGICLFTGWEE